MSGVRALLWQIFKYGVIGVLATGINFAVAEVCAAHVWPCLGADDPFVRLGVFARADVSDAEPTKVIVFC